MPTNDTDELLDKLADAIAERTSGKRTTKITKLSTLREMTAREITEAQRAGRIDTEALAADRAAEDADRHSAMRRAFKLDPAPNTNTEGA